MMLLLAAKFIGVPIVLAVLLAIDQMVLLARRKQREQDAEIAREALEHWRQSSFLVPR